MKCGFNLTRDLNIVNSEVREPRHDPLRVSVIVSRCLLICSYFVFPVALKGEIVSFLASKYQIIWYYFLPVTKVVLAALTGFRFRRQHT